MQNRQIELTIHHPEFKSVSIGCIVPDAVDGKSIDHSGYILRLSGNYTTEILLEIFKYDRSPVRDSEILKELENELLGFVREGIETTRQIRGQVSIEPLATSEAACQMVLWTGQNSIWIARAYHIDDKRFLLAHWNGPKEVALDQVLPILESFEITVPP